MGVRSRLRGAEVLEGGKRGTGVRVLDRGEGGRGEGGCQVELRGGQVEGGKVWVR